MRTLKKCMTTFLLLDNCSRAWLDSVLGNSDSFIPVGSTGIPVFDLVIYLPFLINKINPFKGHSLSSLWDYWVIFSCSLRGTFYQPLLGYILLVLFEGHSINPYWGTSYLPFLRTFYQPLLGAILPALFERHSTNPYWGPFYLPFLRDILSNLIGGHSACPFWGTFH